MYLFCSLTLGTLKEASFSCNDDSGIVRTANTKNNSLIRVKKSFYFRSLKTCLERLRA